LGVMPIPCPHFKITIVKRSQGQSAVAGAAYQSGERLFSEYDQRTKFYNKKKELVHAEIMLPSYAPPGYADRATLWNAVEAVENQWNSQLARRIVLAFPVEVPKEQYLSMIKEFCQEQFVSKGMLTFEKVLEIFADYLTADETIEVYISRHGCVRVEFDQDFHYCSGEVCHTPKELFDLLADDYRTYLEIELTKGKREVTEDDEREADALCKQYLERWKEEQK